MSDQTPNEKKRRRSLVSLGEMIALAALVVSGLGLWITWRESGPRGPTEIVEKERAIPLVLRGRIEDDGKLLVIAPAASSHTIDSVTLTFAGGSTVTLASDGELAARAVEGALAKPGKREGNGSVRVTADSNYFEGGNERQAKRAYVIRYRWEGGGLFDSKELRLTGFSRG